MKTILFGPIGRHNFGDMLFPHVLTSLLREHNHAGEIEYCDIMSRDMRDYGGHNVQSISKYLDYPDPINVIHVGGQTGICPLHGAVKMFHGNRSNMRELALLQQANLKLGYIIPKSIFKQPNIFVTNCIGNHNQRSYDIIKHFDFNSFRNAESTNMYNKNRRADEDLAPVGIHLPDSVVLLRKYFDDMIADRSVTSESLTQLYSKVGKDYVAIQFKAAHLVDPQPLIKQCSDIIRELNLPIVFFCAGLCPGHDAPEVYIKHFKSVGTLHGDLELPSDMVHVFSGANIWDICNLISRATCVISTSLHARIVSAVYARPRLTVNLWEATNKKTPQYVKTCQHIREWEPEFTCANSVNNVCVDTRAAIENNKQDAQLENITALQSTYFNKSTWITKIANSRSDI